MTLELWLAFSAAALALLIIPGPTVLMVLSYALSQGRRVALATVAGVALGDFIAMTTSLLGLGALVMASPLLFTLLKWFGALYLIWLGYQLMRASSSQGLHAETDLPPIAPTSVFRHAVMVTSLNPKSIAFFIAFVPQFVNATAPVAPQFVILVITFVALAALNALVYALAVDRMRAKIARPGTLRALNRAGGLALMAMGVLIALLRHSA